MPPCDKTWTKEHDAEERPGFLLPPSSNRKLELHRARFLHGGRLLWNISGARGSAGPQPLYFMGQVQRRAAGEVPRFWVYCLLHAVDPGASGFGLSLQAGACRVLGFRVLLSTLGFRVAFRA